MLTSLQFEVSTYCGADCVMCVLGKVKNKNKCMSFDVFKKAIDEGAEMGVELVSFGFMGDCFLDKGLLQKLKYVKDTYPHISVRAGNTMQVYDEDILQYVDVLSISNYGMTKATYESVHRGSLVFEDVQANIHKLLNMPKEKRPYVHMYFLCLPENAHEMEAWKAYWEDKVDEIWIWKPHTFGGKLEGYEAVEKRGEPHSCGRGVNTFSIRVDGTVTVCCFDPFNELCIGDLNTSSLKDILENSPRFKHIRQVHKECSFLESDLICKDCDQIFDRADALVYTSNPERRVGALIGKGTKAIPLI